MTVKFLFNFFCAAIVGALSIQQAAFAEEIVMRIEAVERRIGSVPDGSHNGVMTLCFTNHSKRKSILNFCCPVGKPILVSNTPTHLPKFNVKGADEHFGVAFAILNYAWINDGGKTALSGASEATDSSIHLEPNASRCVMVPIMLPTLPGTYHLQVTFDNTNLLSVEHSFNNKYAISEDPDSFEHLKTTTQALVEGKL